MNPVVHFELPAEDRQRMVDFYTNTFGWQTEMMGAEMGNYVIATTTERDPVTRMPVTPGAINGGFYQKTPDMTTAYPSIVIAVDDVKAAMKDIVDAGGQVLGEPMDIPGVGAYVSFFDTEGNRVSVLQPLVM